MKKLTLVLAALLLSNIAMAAGSSGDFNMLNKQDKEVFAAKNGFEVLPCGAVAQRKGNGQLEVVVNADGSSVSGKRIAR